MAAKLFSPLLKLRDRQLTYGVGVSEFPWNVNPIIHSAILAHKLTINENEDENKLPIKETI